MFINECAAFLPTWAVPSRNTCCMQCGLSDEIDVVRPCMPRVDSGVQRTAGGGSGVFSHGRQAPQSSFKARVPHGALAVRVKLKSFDAKLVDRSAKQLADNAIKHGAIVSGPIPIPTKISRYIVNRSPHKHKKSREQFEICVHKRLMCFYCTDAHFMKSLGNIQLPAGVGVSIKTGS